MHKQGVTGMRAELFRKGLHVICFMLLLVVLFSFDRWYWAVLAVAVFTVLVYPILSLVEHHPGYSRFFSERKRGEVKRSLLLVAFMIVVLMTVFWGWLGEGWKYTIVVAVLAWGLGDAAAALVGKAYGRRYISHRLIEGRKTLEGTLAMLVVSWAAIFFTTLISTHSPWFFCFVTALLVAPVCALVELFSRRGTDTLTVPLSAALSTYLWVSLSTALEVIL